MLQIKNTLGGGKPEGLYVWKKHEIGSEPKIFNKSVSTLPYSFYGGSAVMLNGEIHILGGADSTTKHYKWDGTNWTSVSTLPYNFCFGAAVVLNGEIHIFGSSYSSSYYKYHYKWNGSSWSEVSTLPYDFYEGCAVVLNGEIHIMGTGSTNNYKKHYKWNGSSWNSVSTLPYGLYQSSAVVLNGEIHIFGSNNGSAYYKTHYKWDGSSWTSVSTLPYNFYGGSAVVFENEIHILGTSQSSNYYTAHYKYDGTSWVSVSTLPYSFTKGSAVIFDSGIHILGSDHSSYRTAHYLIIGYTPTYTFLDYIVSDKETAYPDGGEKGGYWYEKIYSIDPKLFGFTKIAIDEFTVANRTTVYASAPFVINHSLGEKPKVAFLKVKDYSQTLETGDLFFSMRIGGSIDGRTGSSSDSVDYTSYASSTPTGCSNYCTVAGNSYPYIELWDSSTITIKNSTTSTTYRKYIPACDFELITMA